MGRDSQNRGGRPGAGLFDYDAAPPPRRAKKGSGMQMLHLELPGAGQAGNGPASGRPSNARQQRPPAQNGGKKRRKKQAARPGAPRPARGAPQSPPRGNNNPQNADYRPGAPRQQRRITQVERRRIRRNRRIAGLLLVAAALTAGVLLSVNLLFKVTEFRVENVDRSTPADTSIYTEQQIIDLVGVETGTNLFGFSTGKKTQELAQALPYLDVVEVHIRLPGTVVIKVQPAVERFALQAGSQWATLSEGLKVLKFSDSRPEGLIWLEAELEPDTRPAVGQVIALKSTAISALSASGAATAETAAEDAGEGADQQSANETVTALTDALAEHGLLDGVTMLTVTDMTEVNFLYGGRVSVKLGTVNNLDYKLRLAASVILDTDGKGLSSTDRGTLDVSYQREDGDIWAYFEPAAPTPTATPAPEQTEQGDAA